MYKAIEVGFADAPRLLNYKVDNVFGVEFNLKGFDYPWIVQSRKWRKSDKVLDVGSGFSSLPSYLAEKYGCEVWAVDDFGISSDEPFWTRGKDVNEFIQNNPKVNYILERIGNLEHTSLQENYFDCIYSASALEHIPSSGIRSAWSHMHLLLKEGGVMLHAIDIGVPTGRGLFSISKATLLDLFSWFLPTRMIERNAYYTPKTYFRLVSKTLGGVDSSSYRIDLRRMLLDPEIVFEPLDWAYNRIIKDGYSQIVHRRVLSFLLHFEKLQK